jgi:HEAT repeat protein
LQLERHLAALKTEGVIETWTFRDIDAGAEWRQAINANLEAADIVLLLVSSAFLASDYCVNIEMKRALERHARNDCIVVPIILRPCDWRTSAFAHLQPLPKAAKPVTTWRNRDNAWTSAVLGLRHIADRKQEPSALESPSDIPAMDLRPPLYTAITTHATSGASVVTKGERPRILNVALGPIGLEFDLTNPNHCEMAIHTVSVKVVQFEAACLIRAIPYMCLGKIRRYKCRVGSSVGQLYGCSLDEADADYIKLASGELERFEISVDASAMGAYMLAVSVRYSVAGTVGDLLFGESQQVVFMGRSDTDEHLGHLQRALVGDDTVTREQAVMELCELWEDRYSQEHVKVAKMLNQSSAVALLVEALENNDGVVRRRAAQALGDLRVIASVPTLINCLRSGRLTYAAAEALATIGAQALQQTAELFHDSNPAIRALAVRAMARAGPEAIVCLRPCLHDLDENVRRETADILGTIGGDDGIAALLVLLEDVAPNVRMAAAKQLGRLAATSAAVPLRSSLLGGNVAAADALGQLRPPDVCSLLLALQQPNVAVRLAAVDALGDLAWLFTERGGSALPTELLMSTRSSIISGLKEAVSDDAAEVSRASVTALAMIGVFAGAELIGALSSGDLEIRRIAYNALAKLRSAVLPELVNAVHTSDDLDDSLYRLLYNLGAQARYALQATAHACAVSDSDRVVTILARLNADTNSRNDTAARIGKATCTNCSALILPDTAKRTGGVCKPCYNRDRL